MSDGEAVKVGRAVNIENRLRSMQSGHSKRFTLLAAFLAYPWVEHKLHRVFAASRIGGEWFRPTPELMALIDRVNRGESPLLQLMGASDSDPIPGPCQIASEAST